MNDKVGSIVRRAVFFSYGARVCELPESRLSFESGRPFLVRSPYRLVPRRTVQRGCPNGRLNLESQYENKECACFQTERKSNVTHEQSSCADLESPHPI